MAARMESIYSTSHSTFVKSDLRKFDLTWQLDPILHTVELDLAATDLRKSDLTW